MLITPVTLKDYLSRLNRLEYTQLWDLSENDFAGDDKMESGTHSRIIDIMNHQYTCRNCLPLHVF